MGSRGGEGHDNQRLHSDRITRIHVTVFVLFGLSMLVVSNGIPVLREPVRLDETYDGSNWLFLKAW